MKIKLKKGVILPNNWKQCGYTMKDWEDLNNGKTVEMQEIPNLIEKYVDAVESVSKIKKKDRGDK